MLILLLSYKGEFGKVSPQEFPGIDVLRQELTDHAESQEDPQVRNYFKDNNNNIIIINWYM